MRNAIRFTSCSAIVLAASAVIASAPAAGDSDLAIPWSSIDGGGTMSAGGGFTLHATIGQPDAGRADAGAITHIGGFHAGFRHRAAPCLGDVDGSGAIDFDDLLAVLSAWGACAGCAADLDGSATVDFIDLLIILAAWGDCP